MTPSEFASMTSDQRASWVHDAPESEIYTLKRMIDSAEPPVYRHRLAYSAEGHPDHERAWASLAPHERDAHLARHAASYRADVTAMVRAAVAESNARLAREADAAATRARDAYVSAYLQRKLGTPTTRTTSAPTTSAPTSKRGRS